MTYRKLASRLSFSKLRIMSFLPMSHVATVPKKANNTIAAKSSGRIENNITEKATKSRNEFKRIKKKESEKTVKLRTSSCILWSTLSMLLLCDRSSL